MPKIATQLPSRPAMVICPGCKASVQPIIDLHTGNKVIPKHERIPQPGDTKLVSCTGSDKDVTN